MAKNKYIETPEALWQLFEEYQKEVKSKPRYKNVFVGKEGMPEKEYLERPLTIEGFRNFCHRKGKSVEHYFANTDNSYTEYRTICSRVKDEIRQDQIEGGMVGQYNASITQRLNGLTDKVETKNENINRSITVEQINAEVPIANSEKDVSED